VRIWDFKTKQKIREIQVTTNNYYRRMSCMQCTNDKIICASAGLIILDFSAIKS
jgi:hypothetical protein